jgi:hypothetical protein
MIKETTRYIAHCDRCDAVPSTCAVGTTKESAFKMALAYSWRSVGERLYCRDCQARKDVKKLIAEQKQPA